jgi:hypothetical protein
MMLVDAPMALLAHLRRDQPPGLPDEETVGWLREAVLELDPDPLFRRRMRGRLLNGYVEVREGMRRPAPAPTGIGRIGRAVLYASLTMAVGATAVGAASRDALPGDPLYSVKMAIEHIRTDLAPASVQRQLAAASLDTRIEELARLAAKGNWALAAASAQEVAAELRRLETMGGAPSAEETEIEHRLSVLTAVLEKAPPAAREGLQRAIAASEEAPGQQPSVGAGAARPASTPASAPSPRPERTARPERTPHPTPASH